MSRNFTQFTQGFNNVAAGGTATTKAPRNRRAHAIYLQYKTNANQATIEADITQVRVIVNNNVVRTFSAVELNLINAFYGFTFQAGILPIYFSDPRRRTPEGEEFLAWLIYEDLGVADLEIQVDIAGGAAAPTLTAWMAWDYQRPIDQIADILPAGYAGVTDAMRAAAPGARSVMHWIRKPVVCGAAAPFSAPLSPVGLVPAVNGFLHKMHAFDAVVTGIQLRNGQTPFWNVTSVQLPALLQPYGLSKQAATMHGVIDFDTQYGDGLYIPDTPELTVDFTTSAAATGNQFILTQEIRKLFTLR